MVQLGGSPKTLHFPSHVESTGPKNVKLSNLGILLDLPDYNQDASGGKNEGL